MLKETIVIIDDESFIRENVQRILSEDGYRVLEAANGAEALELVSSDEIDLALLDLNLGTEKGLDLLGALKEANPDLLVIIITGYGSVETAVDALKLGAFDYMKKPFKADALRVIVKLALQTPELKREVRGLRRSGALGLDVPLLGESPCFRQVLDQVREVARIPTATVLVTGESGTGKELVARAIHDRSSRKDQPFMAINCAAIPETLIESELFGHEKGSFTGANAREIGILEAANGGTVFLDEIGEMNVSMQAKLLRAIQEKEIRRVGGKVNLSLDVRIVSATNRDLEQEIKRGAFREDLFYRLNVIRITLPPLRERGSDIATLANFFVTKYREASGIGVEGISKPALRQLMNYTWPGNVRQLESVIERAVLMAESSIIQPEDLPTEISSLSETAIVPFELPPEGINFEEMEKALITKAMDRADWVIGKAAPILGLSYKTLQYRLDKHGIEKPERKGKA